MFGFESGSKGCESVLGGSDSGLGGSDSGLGASSFIVTLPFGFRHMVGFESVLYASG